MEKMRIYVTNDVSETALAYVDTLDGIEAGDEVIVGVGQPRPEENSVVLFYNTEAGKGELRIPFSCIAIADEGVVRGSMKRTI